MEQDVFRDAWFVDCAQSGVVSAADSHLTSRDELQRAQSDLEIGGVGLELVESASDGGLELRGVLAGRAVRRDLVELGGTHVGGCRRKFGSVVDLQRTVPKCAATFGG